ncbi:hypothetical protein ACPYPG_34315 [Streptomyces sp. FR-108]|uniref:hypothetical protein n=1 Tax=Streptomyces sp. FR-108 TaxID=3416665 RepID=UPI003CFB2B3F
MFTHVRDVSERSDNASTRRPDNRAATLADAMSAAADTGCGFFGLPPACPAGAATAAPSISDTDISTASPPAIQRRPPLLFGRIRPLCNGEGTSSTGLTNLPASQPREGKVINSQSIQGHNSTKIIESGRIRHSRTPPRP